MQTALDKIIGYLAPQRALGRAAARAAMARMARGFDGAKLGRRTDGWQTGATSATAEIAPSLSRLRARSRDLRRNNPLAAKILNVLVTNAIGTGVLSKLSAEQARWDRWCDGECDADGRLDMYGLQKLAADTAFESGEALVRLRQRRLEDGLAVPLQLQMLEPDHLDTSKQEELAGGGYICSGIEFDALGSRVAYWLFPTHPGDQISYRSTMVSRRVPAESVLHVFEQTRPGQMRGYPRLAPVIMKLRDIDDYQEAELIRKGFESCFVGVIHTDDDANPAVGQEQTEAADAHGTAEEAISAGTFKRLRPGEDITFGQPSAVQGYNEFLTAQQRDACAGGRVPFELGTGNLSQVNYTSHRAGLLEFRRDVEQWQWLTFIPQFCRPVVGAFKRAAAGAMVRGALDITATYTPPKWDWTDPLKDASGELLEVAAGLKSWQESVRRRGYDPQAVLAEIAEDQKSFADAGVALKFGDLLLGAAAIQQKGSEQ